MAGLVGFGKKQMSVVQDTQHEFIIGQDKLKILGTCGRFHERNSLFWQRRELDP